ncbi:MAG: AAA family ATPase [Clostridium sp.]
MGKNLILIGGTMGVGKSKTSERLLHALKNAVWLDGDWCWRMSPFIVNEENKSMVLDNIAYMLNNFINNSHLENIIFSWVMDDSEIIDLILSRIGCENLNIITISLICSKEELKNRISRDYIENNRTDRYIEKSYERMNLYNSMDTIKIDTTNNTIDETVIRIQEML